MRRKLLQSVAELSQFIESGDLQYAAQHISETWPANGPGRWFEWLLRPQMDDPDLSTREFIDAVESLELSLDLDLRIVQDAIAWLDLQPINTRLFINVSTATLSNQHFTEFVVNTIEQGHLVPGQVCFDMTLNNGAEHFTGVSRFIRTVRELGCKIALDMDDRGNALLGLLAPLGLIDFLKVQPAWVRAAPESPAHRQSLQSLCDYGRRLGVPLVAKGVDSEAQLDLIRELGVDYYQGFIDGEPQLVQDPQSDELQQTA